MWTNMWSMNALHAQFLQANKRRNVQIMFVTCLLLLLLLLRFYHLKISNLKSTSSHHTFSTTTQDVLPMSYVKEKPWKPSWKSPEPTWSITCDTSHFEYDLCYLNRTTVVNPSTAILSVVDPTNSTPPSAVKIRPYPRKGQPEAMARTKELTITTSPPNASCAITHRTPALVFSAGGFTGNAFHDFNEGWVPLFITANDFFDDRDVILAIVNCSEWWMIKYAELFPQFTRHPIINLDKESAVHCFPSAIVGLKSHGVMHIDPTLQDGPHPKSMLDFHALLANAYTPSHSRASNAGPTFTKKARPKLAFLNRTDTRKLLNEPEVRRAAEEVGFEVVVFEITPETPVRELFRLVDSCHAMVGVHGAGLTHEMFLRPGSVFVQIVPINCGWLADICYGKLGIRLGLEYIVYEVGLEESSLRKKELAVKEYLESKYPASSLMGNLTNWYRYMNQDIEIDVVRFKRYLKRAYDKAKVFMQKQTTSPNGEL